MIWRDGKVKVADGRWWGRMHELLDEGQVFVVQIPTRTNVDPWTAAEVRAAIDGAAPILHHDGTKANVVEIQESGRPTLPSERRSGGRRGGKAGA